VTSYWRARARTVIGEAIAAGQAAGEDLAAITRRIDAAYPFGPREHWPYKVWLNERSHALDRLRAAVGGPVARPCPACGARPGKPCRDIVGGQPVAWHVSRVQGDSGPLFGAAS
jgi:hypothetical protein